MHFFPVREKQNWNVIDILLARQSLLLPQKALRIGKVTAEYNLSIFSTETLYLTDFIFTISIYLLWTAK